VKDRTPLEYGLMCLIARAPHSGSQLVRLLRRYPLAGTGKSPGAVYPALYRLEAAGLVCWRRRRSSRGRDLFRGEERGRGVREWGLTREGVSRLRGWATKRVTRREVLERPEHLLLRFTLCTGLSGPSAARRVALQCRRVCAELASELADGLERTGGESSVTCRLALECALGVLEAQVAWALRAERALWHEARRCPELDLPPPARDVMAALERLPARIRRWIHWPLRDGPPPIPPIP